MNEYLRANLQILVKRYGKRLVAQELSALLDERSDSINPLEGMGCPWPADQPDPLAPLFVTHEVAEKWKSARNLADDRAVDAAKHCTICGQDAVAKGLCSTHYQKQYYRARKGV